MTKSEAAWEWFLAGLDDAWDTRGNGPYSIEPDGFPEWMPARSMRRMNELRKRRLP